MKKHLYLILFSFLMFFVPHFSIASDDTNNIKSCQTFFISSLADALEKYINEKTFDGTLKIAMNSNAKLQDKFQEADSLEEKFADELNSSTYPLGTANLSAESLAGQHFTKDYKAFADDAKVFCSQLNTSVTDESKKLTPEECLVLTVHRSNASKNLSDEQKKKLSSDLKIQVFQLSPAFEKSKFDIVIAAIKKVNQNQECLALNQRQMDDSCLVNVIKLLTGSAGLDHLLDNFCEIGSHFKNEDRISHFLENNCPSSSSSNDQPLVNNQPNERKANEEVAMAQIDHANSQLQTLDERFKQAQGQVTETPKVTPEQNNIKNIELKDERGILSKALHAITDTVSDTFDNLFETGDKVDEKVRLAERNLWSLVRESALEGISLGAEYLGQDKKDVKKLDFSELKAIATRAVPSVKVLLLTAQDPNNPANEQAKEAIQGFLDMAKHIVSLAAPDKNIKIPSLDEILKYDVAKLEAMFETMMQKSFTSQ